MKRQLPFFLLLVSSIAWALASPTISAVVTGPTALTVSWTKVTGAATYQLQKCTGASCVNWSGAYCGTALSSNRSGTAGGIYRYRVRAWSLAGCTGSASPYTAPITVTLTQSPPPPPPPPPPPLGSATLSWTPPTQNTDGSTLTNLAGYKIMYGMNSSSLDSTITLPNPGLAAYVVDSLTQGTWYFAVISYNTANAESVPSNIASKVIQ